MKGTIKTMVGLHFFIFQLSNIEFYLLDNKVMILILCLYYKFLFFNQNFHKNPHNLNLFVSACVQMFYADRYYRLERQNLELRPVVVLELL